MVLEELLGEALAVLGLHGLIDGLLARGRHEVAIEGLAGLGVSERIEQDDDEVTWAKLDSGALGGIIGVDVSDVAFGVDVLLGAEMDRHHLLGVAEGQAVIVGIEVHVVCFLFVRGYGLDYIKFRLDLAKDFLLDCKGCEPHGFTELVVRVGFAKTLTVSLHLGFGDPAHGGLGGWKLVVIPFLGSLFAPFDGECVFSVE